MLCHTRNLYRHACKQKGSAGPSRGAEGAEQKLRRQKGFRVIGNERKDNLRWEEGRAEDGGGQMSGKVEIKERGGKGEGEGSQAREKEIAK